MRVCVCVCVWREIPEIRERARDAREMYAKMRESYERIYMDIREIRESCTWITCERDTRERDTREGGEQDTNERYERNTSERYERDTRDIRERDAQEIGSREREIYTKENERDT